MIDDNNVITRYLKITVLGAEKTGIFAAIWNVKVYEETFDIPLNLENNSSEKNPEAQTTQSRLVEMNPEKITEINPVKFKNRGTLGGSFDVEGELRVVKDEFFGKKVIEFINGNLVLDLPVPKSLAWNGSFSVACWVRYPEIDDKNECLASWYDRTKFHLANSFNASFYNSGNYGAMSHLHGEFDMPYKNLPVENEWHHLVFTFDGVVEKVCVDGKLDNAQNMLLSSAIENAKIRIDASDIGENFTDLMVSFRMYDFALNDEEITELFRDTNSFQSAN